jgi:hypothetical protein
LHRIIAGRKERRQGMEIFFKSKNRAGIFREYLHAPVFLKGYLSLRHLLLPEHPGPVNLSQT